MNITDIIEAVKTGWEILIKIINFDGILEYIAQSFSSITGLF